MNRFIALIALLVACATATPFAIAEAELPLIAAAGDISCPTTEPQYNGGLGTESECAQMRTSDLLVPGIYAKVLPLGDLQYEVGALSQFQTAYESSWGRVKGITAPVPGNHEHNTPGAAGYYDYFNGVGNATGPAGERGKGYYSYDVGTWHVIALNSTCGPKGVTGGCTGKSPQIKWLKNDLASHPNSTYPCTLAYWHHPRFASQSPTQHPMKPAWLQLYNNNADLILNGHKHAYERFAPQTPLGVADSARGIRQIIVGTGGRDFGSGNPTSFIANSEVWNGSTFGIVEVALGAGSYSWNFRPETGSTFTDSGATVCH